jgi:hypothetical protein
MPPNIGVSQTNNVLSTVISSTGAAASTISASQAISAASSEILSEN